MSLMVDFGGEVHHVDGTAAFLIGREGDLAIDDNPYLHRRFLEIRLEHDLWWLINVGGQLSTTVCDRTSSVQAWLAPKGRMPLVFDVTIVRFTAGPTAYSLDIHLGGAPYVMDEIVVADQGSTTIGRVTLSMDQRLALLVLAEGALRRGASGSADVPSATGAARRLGWTPKKFEKKLDNLCEKFAALGVRGLKGEQGNLASSRRARLVEYAVAARLVTTNDLVFLEQASSALTGQSDAP